MTRDVQRDPDSMISRRSLVQGLAITAGATAIGAGGALAQHAGDLGPPSTITCCPAARFRPPAGAPTTYFWDPDIIAVDPSFNSLAQPNTAIKRLYTGVLWAEGPAWSAQGRYLLWSDIPNNRQMRWSEDDGRVSVFRSPSEQLQRQPVRLPGPAALLRASHPPGGALRARRHVIRARRQFWRQEKLNSPNDVVLPTRMAASGFTDLPYGGQLYEGEPDAGGKLNPRFGQPAGFVPSKRELPTNCYRVDPAGHIDLVVSEDQVPDPNGLAFSPDYKKLYVVSTGKGPGDTGPGGKGDVFVFDVGADNKLSNQQRLHRFHDRRREVWTGRHALRR